jgi:hypothetical protein
MFKASLGYMIPCLKKCWGDGERGRGLGEVGEREFMLKVTSFLFLAVLEFEFRDLLLLGRCSTT